MSTWAAGVMDQAFEAFSLESLLGDLRRARVEVALVGGAVRDILYDSTAVPVDLDLMVPGDLGHVRSVLDALGQPSVNRHGNLRYRIANNQHVDVMSSRQFYGRQSSVVTALHYFDISVNALAVTAQGNFLDPFDSTQRLRDGLAVLPPKRWSPTDPLEDVHVLLRAIRVIERFDVEIENPEVAFSHRDAFDCASWRDLERLNGFGRLAAEKKFQEVFIPAAERCLSRSAKSLESGPERPRLVHAG